MAGSFASISWNIFANVGTTIQSMSVTAITATQTRIIGYISDALTFRLVSRESRICLFSSVNTMAILPVISPVRMASIHWNSNCSGNAAAAALKLLPAATFDVICSRIARNFVLSHWPVAIFSAWSKGVPELTSVESW